MVAPRSEGRRSVSVSSRPQARYVAGMEFRRISLALRDGAMAGLAFGPDRAPDLVFFHATGFNARTYAPLLAPLADRFAVVALDQRGHGLSRLPADPARLDRWDVYVDDAVAALAALRGSGPAPVVSGHSMGGAVALMAAARAPGAVRSLVLLDPVLPPLARLHTATAWLLVG